MGKAVRVSSGRLDVRVRVSEPCLWQVQGSDEARCRRRKKKKKENNGRRSITIRR